MKTTIKFLMLFVLGFSSSIHARIAAELDIYPRPDLPAYLINVPAPLPEILEITRPLSGPSCVMPDTYLALWNFDIAMGTDDYSANGNNAISITGTVAFDAVDFKEGDQSIVFDGATKIQYSQTPGPFMIAATAARSVGMWVKPMGSYGFQELYDEGGSSNGMAIRLFGSNVESVVRSGSANNLSAAFPMDGDWHHIAVVYDGNNTSHSLYIDGVLAASSITAPATIATHNESGGLGGVDTTDSFGASTDNFFMGKMDAVAVYDFALSAAEVFAVACLEDPNPPTECTYSVINSEGFESGWGIWNDGGSDARRHARDAAYAQTGTFCIRLRDNTSTSVMTTDALDLSIYEELTIDFAYYCRSMDDANEDFWLQISTDGGANFTTVEEWNFSDEFLNDLRYKGQVIIEGPFTSNTQIRFRADASGNRDWVYIDDVVINGCTTTSPPPVDERSDVVKNNEVKVDETVLKTRDFSVYPNPFENQINIQIQGGQYENAVIELFNSLGQSIFVKSYRNEERINVSTQNLSTGQYFLQINIDNKITTKRVLKM